MSTKEVAIYFRDNPIPMIVYDRESRAILESNKAARRLYEYSRTEMNTIKLNDIWTREQVPLYIKDYETYTGDNGSIEIAIHRKKNGETFYARIMENEVTDHNENSRLAVIQDITKQIKIEEKLEEEQHLFQVLTYNLPGTFYILDQTGKMLRWNRELETITEYSHDEIGEMNCLDFFEGTERERVFEAVKKAVTEGAVELEAILKTKTGKEVPFYYKAMRVILDDEPHIVGIGIDSSLIKEAEKENRILLSEIHHRVKNNLAVISGLLELQAAEIDDREIRSELNDCQSRVQSIALIHELLYETKSFSQVNFKKNIQELVQYIRHSHHTEKDINVHYDLDYVELSMNQAIPCTLIINELITNIYKHAFPQQDHGNVNILLKEDQNSHEVKILISDNGIGLPENFSIHQTDSLGLKLIEVLSMQLEADLQYQSNNGASFELTFRKSDNSSPGSEVLP